MFCSFFPKDMEEQESKTTPSTSKHSSPGSSPPPSKTSHCKDSRSLWKSVKTATLHWVLPTLAILSLLLPIFASCSRLMAKSLTNMSNASICSEHFKERKDKEPHNGFMYKFPSALWIFWKVAKNPEREKSSPTNLIISNKSKLHKAQDQGSPQIPVLVITASLFLVSIIMAIMYVCMYNVCFHFDIEKTCNVISTSPLALRIWK